MLALLHEEREAERARVREWKAKRHHDSAAANGERKEKWRAAIADSDSHTKACEDVFSLYAGQNEWQPTRWTMYVYCFSPRAHTRICYQD